MISCEMLTEPASLTKTRSPSLPPFAEIRGSQASLAYRHHRCGPVVNFAAKRADGYPILARVGSEVVLQLHHSLPLSGIPESPSETLHELLNSGKDYVRLTT